MSTCATCQHWQPEPSGIIGECGSPKIIKGYALRDVDFPLDGAHVEDDEGWGIRTAA